LSEQKPSRSNRRGLTLLTVLFLGQGAATWYFMPSARWMLVSHIGKAVAVLGFFGFATLARIELLRQTEWRERANQPVTKQVVDSGIYGIVRHPTYIGYMICAVGLAMIAQHWAAIALGAAIVPYTAYAVLQEERENLSRFGDEYRAYMDRVPRFNLIAGLLRHSGGRGKR